VSPTIEDLNSMTKAQLKELLDSYNISYTTRNNKAELIELVIDNVLEGGDTPNE
jgi:hypothetical protein